MSRELISVLQKLSVAKLQDGKTFVEKTTYKDISFWWFIRFNLFHHINKKINTDNFKLNSNVKSSQNYRQQVFLYSRLLYDFVMSILGRMNVKICKKRESIKQNKILAIDYNIRWNNVLDSFNEESKKINIFFDSIFTTLLRNNDYEIITTDSIKLSLVGLKVLLEKQRKRKNIIHKPFNNYWSWEIWRKGKLARKHFEKIWKELENDNIFINLWKYKTKDLYPLIRDELSFSFICRFPRMVEYIEKAKRLLEEENPDLILLECEYGGVAQALVIAAKFKNIPTLAIQHGSISPFHEAYIHGKNEISPTGDFKSPYYPIPDITAVYGPSDKYYLTEESSYPKNSVIITGQPRYDVLADTNKYFDRKRFLNKLNLSVNKKLIVWTTQSHMLFEPEKKKTVYTIFKAIKELSEEAQLLIKLHPAEKDFALYKTAADEVGITPKIVKDMDIFEVLNASDIVISRHSTTATEALILNKALIIINLSGEVDLTSYVRENVAIGVYEEKKLLTTIKNILHNEEVRDDLKKNREKFVYKTCYNIDGKATDRVVKLIKKMVNKNYSS